MDDKIVETNFYDEVEVHHDCTVEILRNSVTGEVSIGWYDNNNPPKGRENEKD